MLVQYFSREATQHVSHNKIRQGTLCFFVKRPYHLMGLIFHEVILVAGTNLFCDNKGES